MAEDHSQRPYRSNETIARTGQARGAAPGGSGLANDPLAELARLIGQTDPFGDAISPARTRADSATAAPTVEWAAPSTQPHQSFAPADFAAAEQQVHATQQGAPYYAHQTWTQPFEEPAPAEEAYQAEQEIPAYLTQRGGQDAPAHEAYGAGDPFEPGHDDDYDEAPPRRRMKVMLLAAVFGLAVLGTAGAFSYRSLFGSGSRVPPVIQADKSPLKVVPENAGGQGGKAIADRVTDQGEKILAREEKPVDINRLVQASAPPQASAGNGVVAGEPKKVHTIVIRPDGSGGQPVAMASPMPSDAGAAQAAPLAPSTTTATTTPTTPARPKADREAPRAAQQQPAAEASASAPLSLAPDAAPASRPVRTANAAPAASAPSPQAHVPAYAVQVASQKTEAEAKAAYQAVLKKYPHVLEGKTMFVYSVDLGAKGTYYRAMIGPYSAASDASGLCSALKSAGGSCLIQRN